MQNIIQGEAKGIICEIPIKWNVQNKKTRFVWHKRGMVNERWLCLNKSVLPMKGIDFGVLFG